MQALFKMFFLCQVQGSADTIVLSGRYLVLPSGEVWTGNTQREATLQPIACNKHTRKARLPDHSFTQEEAAILSNTPGQCVISGWIYPVKRRSQDRYHLSLSI